MKERTLKDWIMASRPWSFTASIIPVIATACYTLVHVWSFNPMLLVAAAACGFCWGLLYCLRPQMLPALIVPHALWDAAAFVVFPF